MTESELLYAVRLALTPDGARLFRNNVGVAIHANGTRTRYGLCPGSSDLVGWVPVKITEDFIGQSVAIFTALEAKAPKGKPTTEQVNFITRVQEAGGIAGIIRSVSQAFDLIDAFSGGRGSHGGDQF